VIDRRDEVGATRAAVEGALIEHYQAVYPRRAVFYS
jgi:hypothetical protein